MFVETLVAIVNFSSKTNQNNNIIAKQRKAIRWKIVVILRLEEERGGQEPIGLSKLWNEARWSGSSGRRTRMPLRWSQSIDI